MVVQTKKEAWEAAKKMSVQVTDLVQIADLGVRLQVKTDNYEITNIWITEQIGEEITEEIEQEAEKLSDKFVYNYFKMNGKLSSKEFRKNTIFRIAAQALKKMKSANSTEELFDIFHEAEILLEKEIKECKGYSTIFEPLIKVMLRWRKEGKLVRRNHTFMEESEQKTELEIEKKTEMIEEHCSIIEDDSENMLKRLERMAHLLAICQIKT